MSSLEIGCTCRIEPKKRGLVAVADIEQMKKESEGKMNGRRLVSAVGTVCMANLAVVGVPHGAIPIYMFWLSLLSEIGPVLVVALGVPMLAVIIAAFFIQSRIWTNASLIGSLWLVGVLGFAMFLPGSKLLSSLPFFAFSIWNVVEILRSRKSIRRRNLTALGR